MTPKRLLKMPPWMGRLSPISWPQVIMRSNVRRRETSKSAQPSDVAGTPGSACYASERARPSDQIGRVSRCSRPPAETQSPRPGDRPSCRERCVHGPASSLPRIVQRKTTPGRPGEPASAPTGDLQLGRGGNYSRCGARLAIQGVPKTAQEFPSAGCSNFPLRGSKIHDFGAGRSC